MLSRIWYIVLAAAVALALASAFLMQSVARREGARHTEELIVKDKTDVDILLQLDVNLRQLVLTQLQGDSELIAAARDSSNREGALDASGIASVESRLKKVNRDLEKAKSDMLALIDAKGEMVGAYGLGARPPAGTLKSLDFVKNALSDKAASGFWNYNGNIYRVVAVALRDGYRVVGAVLQGMRVDEDLTKRLAGRLPGASLAFSAGNEMIASYESPNGTPKSVLATLIKDRANKTADEAGVSKIEDYGDHFWGAYSSLQTGNTEIGYVVARKASDANLSILKAPTSEDMRNVPWHWVVIIPLLLGGAGLFVLRKERNQPLDQLLVASRQLANRETQMLPALELRTPFRQIAQHVNDALMNQAKELAERQSLGNGDQNGMGQSAPAARDEFAEENTTVQNVPENLLAAMSSAGKKPEMEDVHFRDVFRDFVDTRRRCGETVEGLTYEKFVTKLRQTKNDMISKQGAKTVKFSVYMKDGKAALKATPDV